MKFVAKPVLHQTPLQPVNGQPNDEDAGADGKAAVGGRPRRRFVELLMDEDDAAEHDISTASVGATAAVYDDDDNGAAASAAGMLPESPSLQGPRAKRVRTRAVALRG